MLVLGIHNRLGLEELPDTLRTEQTCRPDGSATSSGTAPSAHERVGLTLI